MKVGLRLVALQLLLFCPSGRATGLRMASPPPKPEEYRALQENNRTVENFTVPNSNSTETDVAAGKGSSSEEEQGDPNNACCDGKPKSLTLGLTATGCGDSTNPQGDKFECQGNDVVDDGSFYEIRVLQTDRAVFDGTDSFTSAPLQVGDQAVIRPTSDKFKSDTTFKIFKCGAASTAAMCIAPSIVQDLKIHLSCSKELNLEDIFGGLTLKDYNDGDRTIRCAICINDESREGQDTGCSAFEPLCDGLPEEAGEACHLCINDKLHGLKDTGCTDECPLCATGADMFGSECSVCFNNGMPAFPDPGCPQDRPVCNAMDGSYGPECLVCTVSVRPIDPGCDATNPICSPGIGCFKCQNDQETDSDLGCSNIGDCPHCVAPMDAFGDQCAFCINDKPGDVIDTGCTATTPVCVADWDEGGMLCARCINDQPGDQPDTGCSDLAFPRCNAAFGQPGEEDCLPRLTPLPMMQQGDTFPAINGQATNLRPEDGSATPLNAVCGAVQAVLAHPTDPDICFAGGVNGGVWRTTTCTQSPPTWEPLTDQEDSSSIGDMVFDESDTTRNTILVGIGTLSAYQRRGGPAIGMLYTRDALSAGMPTWQVIDNSAGTVDFRTNNVKFRSVFVRGDLMLAAAYDADPFFCSRIGIFRSTNRGVTWTNVLEGVAFSVASDPNDEMRFYATLDFTGTCSATDPIPLVDNGVFVSNDEGETWEATNYVTGIPQGELTNAKLSVFADQSRVWSALIENGAVNSISYSDNQGMDWTTLDPILVPGTVQNTGLHKQMNPQGAIHFALLASPSNRNEVYVGGDRQSDNEEQDGTLPNFPNNLGADDYTGILFRGDASIGSSMGAVPSGQWEHMTDDTGIADFPDGGTASGSGPHADCRDMEVRADGSILEGDDGGVTIRTNPGDNTGDWFGLCGDMQVFESHSVAYEPVLNTVLFGTQDTGNIAGTLGTSGTFFSVSLGDGNAPMIDFASDPNNVYYYYASQNLGRMWRDTRDSTTGNQVARVRIEGNWGDFRGSFVSVRAMNPMDQRIFAVATNNVADMNTRPYNMIQITEDRGDSFTNVDSMFPGDDITAMEWSHDGRFLYVAARSRVKRCTLAGGCPAGSVFVGGFVTDLAVDPRDWNVVYAVTTLSLVFESTDGGATWTDITEAPSLLSTAADLGSAVAYISNNDVSTVVVGTTNGVLVPDDGTSGWQLLAVGLPKVPVYEMVYDETDDILVVSTLGRGVWFLNQASAAVDSAPFATGMEWFPMDQDLNGTSVIVDFGSGPPLEQIPPIEDPPPKMTKSGTPKSTQSRRMA